MTPLECPADLRPLRRQFGEGTSTLPARIKTVPRRVLSPDAAGHTHQPKETP